jgi:hypothetical protein
VIYRKRSVALLIALECAALLLLAEIVVRAFRPQHTYSDWLELTDRFYVSSDYLPFTLKSNYRGSSRAMDSAHTKVVITTNELGLRGVLPVIDSARKRILIIGDSYTFGVYVSDNQTYSAKLQNLLTQRGCAVDVINAGYAGGWGPDTQYAWLSRHLAQLKPDLVVYGFFVGNDLDDINQKAWTALDQSGLPLRISDVNTYVDRQGRVRSRIRDYKTVASEWVYRVPVLRESHLAVLANRVALRVLGFERVNAGWGENAFRWILRPKSDSSMLAAERRFRDLIIGMDALAAAYHSEYLVLMIPMNIQVDQRFLPRVMGSGSFSIKRDYYRELQPWLDSVGIPYINVLGAMQAAPGHYFPENGEVHLNVEGHEFVARQMLRQIAAAGLCN